MNNNDDKQKLKSRQNDVSTLLTKEWVYNYNIIAI